MQTNIKKAPHLERGIIQIYWGDGKGKTTAAIGQALRALGNGLKVYIAQFLKPPGSFSGEVAALHSFGPDVILRRPNLSSLIGAGITANEKAREGNLLLEELKYAGELINRRAYDLFIFDELLTAMDLHLIDESAVLGLFQIKPHNIEMILTGLKPTQKIIDRAELVTEMRLVKHPFLSGLKARKGIEY